MMVVFSIWIEEQLLWIRWRWQKVTPIFAGNHARYLFSHESLSEVQEWVRCIGFGSPYFTRTLIHSFPNPTLALTLNLTLTLTLTVAKP
jgi:hypothetical protein